MRKLCCVLLFLFLATTAHAQVQLPAKFKLASGFITAEAKPALHFQAGIEPVFGRFMFSVNFLDVGLTSGEASGRYRNETTSDGRTICRDGSNGQFADSENCAPPTDAYFAFTGDAKYDISKGKNEAFVGVGYRIGRGSTPYGTMSVRPSSNPSSIFLH